MSDIKVKTLTQVHVGNGLFLQKGNDFIVSTNGAETFVDVLSTNKIGEIIKLNDLILQEWTDAIIHDEAEAFVQKFVMSLPYEAYSKRRIKLSPRVEFNKWQKTVKEQIHDGMGRPYIPGSSIKGALRTAVFSIMARPKVMPLYNKMKEEEEIVLNEEPDKEKRKQKLNEIRRNFENAIIKMEKTLIGSMENDFFRFISTGDAFFPRGSEIGIREMNLNITNRSTLMDQTKSQIVEAISSNSTSSFRLTIKQDFFNKSGFKDEMNLFGRINEYTKILIQQEIDFWRQKIDYYGQDYYIANLKKILNEVSLCRPNETVLRIGQASGWRFVTGAWLEELMKVEEYNKSSNKYQTVFRSMIVPKCRKERYYGNYEDFPKSRRIESSSNVLGVVKLTAM